MKRIIFLLCIAFMSCKQTSKSAENQDKSTGHEDGDGSERVAGEGSGMHQRCFQLFESARKDADYGESIEDAIVNYQSLRADYCLIGKAERSKETFVEVRYIVDERPEFLTLLFKEGSEAKVSEFSVEHSDLLDSAAEKELMANLEGALKKSEFSSQVDEQKSKWEKDGYKEDEKFEIRQVHMGTNRPLSIDQYLFISHYQGANDLSRRNVFWIEREMDSKHTTTLEKFEPIVKIKIY